MKTPSKCSWKTESSSVDEWWRVCVLNSLFRPRFKVCLLTAFSFIQLFSSWEYFPSSKLKKILWYLTADESFMKHLACTRKTQFGVKSHLANNRFQAWQLRWRCEIIRRANTSEFHATNAGSFFINFGDLIIEFIESELLFSFRIS